MIALPNYDSWKTNPDVFEIEYHAQGSMSITLRFDLEGTFGTDAVPHSHDEYYQTIKDDVEIRLFAFARAANRKLKEDDISKYGAELEIDSVDEADVEVISNRGSWA